MIFSIFLIVGVTNLADGVLSVMLAPFINKVLLGDARVFGWILTAGGVGGIIGGVIISRLNRFASPALTIRTSALAIGLIMLVIVRFPSIPLMLTLQTLMGIPAVGVAIGADTLLQRDVPDQYRGRIFASYGTTLALMSLGGMGVASAIGNAVGIVPMMYLSAIVSLIAGILALILLRNISSKSGYAVSNTSLPE